jgi:hypothetical protein
VHRGVAVVLIDHSYIAYNKANLKPKSLSTTSEQLQYTVIVTLSAGVNFGGN